jgi:hypothetical protein
MQLPTILLGLASAFPHQLKRFMRHASGESIRAGGNRKGGAGQSELERRGITITHLLMERPPNRRLQNAQRMSVRDLQLNCYNYYQLVNQWTPSLNVDRSP